jgi:hypothetical protein
MKLTPPRELLACLRRAAGAAGRLARPFGLQVPLRHSLRVQLDPNRSASVGFSASFRLIFPGGCMVGPGHDGPAFRGGLQKRTRQTTNVIIGSASVYRGIVYDAEAIGTWCACRSVRAPALVGRRCMV